MLARGLSEPSSPIVDNDEMDMDDFIDDEEDEEEVETASPKKKSRKAVSPPPDIDDAEFEALQQKLFGDKGKGKPASTSKEPSDSKPKRSTRTKKTK